MVPKYAERLELKCLSISAPVFATLHIPGLRISYYAVRRIFEGFCKKPQLLPRDTRRHPAIVALGLACGERLLRQMLLPGRPQGTLPGLQGPGPIDGRGTTPISIQNTAEIL